MPNTKIAKQSHIKREANMSLSFWETEDDNDFAARFQRGEDVFSLTSSNNYAFDFDLPMSFAPAPAPSTPSTPPPADLVILRLITATCPPPSLRRGMTLTHSGILLQGIRRASGGEKENEEKQNEQDTTTLRENLTEVNCPNYASLYKRTQSWQNAKGRTRVSRYGNGTWGTVSTHGQFSVRASTTSSSLVSQQQQQQQQPFSQSVLRRVRVRSKTGKYDGWGGTHQTIRLAETRSIRPWRLL